MVEIPAVHSFREYIAKISVPTTYVPIRTSSDELDIRNVTVRYAESTRPAVNNFSLTVHKGEMIAIVGANGAGKTSLVNALIGLAPMASGQITIDGSPITALGPEERLSYFGVLNQDYGRYEITVRENLRMGSRHALSDEEYWLSLDFTNASGFVRELPDGLDTLLGEQWGGAGLSGGQWQRLALSRIILRNAGIWLLDEPTSAIDAETEEEIFQFLSKNRNDRIIIVVSHRSWTLKAMDRIYVMKQGSLLQVGSYKELLSQPNGEFSRMFRSQRD
ncbi:ATP-binding cassette domain-containing protein [Propionibacterium cyclohexanicum]|nr:ATP-binding cassette domain-containing protein [Propionibacterium cyclohexanicum]